MNELKKDNTPYLLMAIFIMLSMIFNIVLKMENDYQKEIIKATQENYNLLLNVTIAQEATLKSCWYNLNLDETDESFKDTNWNKYRILVK